MMLLSINYEQYNETKKYDLIANLIELWFYEKFKLLTLYKFQYKENNNNLYKLLSYN